MPGDQKDYNDFINILVVGDEAAGKSQIISQFVFNEFKDSPQSTRAIDLNIKEVKERDSQVKVYIKEVGGKPNFKAIIPTQVSETNVFIVACDLTKAADGLDKAASYIQIIKQGQKNTHSDAKIILVGTKSDLIDTDKETIKKFESFAQEQQCEYFLTSARRGAGVTNLFKNAIELGFDNKLDREKEKSIQAEQDRKKKLQDGIEHYIKRIEQDQGQNKNDFTQGFRLFKKIQADHREANYIFARELFAQLKDSKKSVAEIFKKENIKELRKSMNLPEKIHSDDLNYLIKAGQNPNLEIDLNKLKKTTKGGPSLSR